MSNNLINAPVESPLNAIYGENPLLHPLGARIPFEDIPLKLTNRPLDGYNPRGLDATGREELLFLYEQNFVPTPFAIGIAAAIQNLHRRHYWQRHPRNPAVIRDRNKIAQFTSSRNFNPKLVPWLDTNASGMIIKGITGTGKTAIVNRYSRLLRDQVYVHSNGEIPGFDYIRQIAWLKVDMSSDGSRDGFLTSILLEVDKLIDTDYARQYAGRYSVDKLAIVVGVILSTRLCGLLIIEEIQEKNFNNSMWRNELTTFFLRILNFGIPTVLIGNPLGFAELEKSSQNTRRLSSGGVYEMLPSFDGTDTAFTNLVEQTLTFNVMEAQNPEAREHFRNIAYAYSGGITDFVVRLNMESQLTALHCGQREVSPKHINAAFMNARLAPNHTLIGALVNRNLNMLRQCTDVPISRFAEIWGDDQQKNNRKLDTKTSELEQKPSEVDAQRRSEKMKQKDATGADADQTKQLAPQITGHPLAKQFKAKQTHTVNQRKKAEAQKKLLEPNDIRTDGAGTSLVAGLKDLLNRKKET